MSVVPKERVVEPSEVKRPVSTAKAALAVFWWSLAAIIILFCACMAFVLVSASEGVGL